MSEPRHIRHTHADRSDTAWCGAPLTALDWAFLGVDHAAYARQQGSAVRLCPACRDAVVTAFRADA